MNCVFNYQSCLLKILSDILLTWVWQKSTIGVCVSWPTESGQGLDIWSLLVQVLLKIRFKKNIKQTR